MIGLGSPADTMRESDVIVLMVSPLLALRLVIDHNTKQGAEFPWFASRPRLDQSDCLINQAPPNLASNRCKRRILESRRNELSGIPNRCDFFGHRRAAGDRPCIGM